MSSEQENCTYASSCSSCKGRVGRPPKYASDAERRAAGNLQRKMYKARKKGLLPPIQTSHEEQEDSKPKPVRGRPRKYVSSDEKNKSLIEARRRYVNSHNLSRKAREASIISVVFNPELSDSDKIEDIKKIVDGVSID